MQIRPVACGYLPVSAVIAVAVPSQSGVPFVAVTLVVSPSAPVWVAVTTIVTVALLPTESKRLYPQGELLPVLMVAPPEVVAVADTDRLCPHMAVIDGLDGLEMVPSAETKPNPIKRMTVLSKDSEPL